jgi:hypothetical protein
VLKNLKKLIDASEEIKICLFYVAAFVTLLLTTDVKGVHGIDVL